MQVYRCHWPKNDPRMIEYHDQEWGVPVHDDTKWFEFITLDTFQAGLSWKTILHKREHFRRVFDSFDFNLIALYDDNKTRELLSDPMIIRNKAKIAATINNAQAFLNVRRQYGTFNHFIWQFVHGKPIVNHWTKQEEIPVTSLESDRMSKAMKEAGFKFVGSTTCYAFMQAAGMVNDHVVLCFRHKELYSSDNLSH